MTVYKAKIDSFYHGSTLDGDGLRSVIFFSGCNLRCGFCHNPETLFAGGDKYRLDEVLSRLMRYKSYYTRGGVTLSGGEPFLQAEFCIELCQELKKLGISVIAETNGFIVDERLISLLDGVRLDVKNQNGEDGEKLISRYKPFLQLCEKHGTMVTLTNVLVPTVNDGEENAKSLNELKSAFNFCQGYKLLPFRKLCQDKYARLSKEFPYQNYQEATKEDFDNYYKKLI